MRRVVVDMQNYLFSDAVSFALKNSDSDFDVHMSDEADSTVELCRLCMPYALLMEVTSTSPRSLEDIIKVKDEVKKDNPLCKAVIVVDENSDKDLASRVVQAKKDGLIDYFIYSSVSAAYLSAFIDTL